MEKILVSAYAVNPYKGSEDGTGWNLVNQIARFQKAIVVTRENNRAPIERYLTENNVPNASNLTFEYYDLPYYLRFWKKGNRGALLYFYLWQLFLPLMIRKRKIEFDIAHHLNFHNDWTPTFLWLLGKPLVWGPIGHHPKMPFQFVKQYGFAAWLKDRATWLVKILFWNLDPFLRLSLIKSEAILAVNSSEKLVHSRFADKITIMPAVASDKAILSTNSKTGFNILSVGRFVALKGFDVTIKSFAKFYCSLPVHARADVKLTLVGKGPEKTRLKRIATEIGIDHAINWIEWVDKADMLRIYQEADAFLFPSHEGAGMVIPEALSFGLPILCFNNFGPGELTDDTCAIRVTCGKYETAITDFADGLNKLFSDLHLRHEMAKNAYKKWAQELNWDAKGAVFQKIYATISAKKTWTIHANAGTAVSYQTQMRSYHMLVESEF